MTTVWDQDRHTPDLPRRHKPSRPDYVAVTRFCDEVDAGFVHAIPFEVPRDILFLDKYSVPYRP